jgi:hypothetical protein
MPNNLYTVILSPETRANLDQWARLHDQTTEEATECIIKQFLQHQDFYKYPRKELEHYLSEYKVKIYRALSISGMNLGQISKRAGLKYETARMHLEELCFAGVVIEKLYGTRIRFFSLNMDNPLTKRILKILDLWYKP